MPKYMWCDLMQHNCRSKKNWDYCHNKNLNDFCFIYRCADLNIADSNDYFNALDSAYNYDFTQLRQLDSRSKFKQYSGKCEGERKKITEAFECRCAYYVKSNSSKCLKRECSYRHNIWSGDNIELMYYQLPVSDSYNGKVDIILHDTKRNTVYLVEYKPDREKSAERLLRMICEISTYYETIVKDNNAVDFFKNKLGVQISNSAVKKAIMFNENSPQHCEYRKVIEQNGKIINLIDKLSITVFVLKDKSTIEKLR